MRYLALGVVLLLSTAGVVTADSGLTGAVAAAFLVRNVDDGLHQIAHARVAEISSAGSLSHDGMRAGTAEVLAWNEGAADPAGNAVSQWIGSDFHRGILSDGSYGRIGCAEAVVDGRHWFACVLAAGSLPAQGGGGPATSAASGSGSVVLPDTSAQLPVVESTGWRWRFAPD
jgi:hypothetical protein